MKSEILTEILENLKSIRTSLAYLMAVGPLILVVLAIRK
jgi:hypothetical protein